MATKNVPVPVDGSASSMRALEYATKRFRDSTTVCLLLLNVHLPLPPSRHVPRALIEDHYARMAEKALKPARGLGRVSGLILGSVAMKVIHLASIPVTLVK